MATRSTNAPIVGEAVRATGLGYWLVAADGGVFAFGDARWDGSLPARALRAPVVGMASRPDGTGYWLAAADGGVYAFGAARYLGGRGNEPVSAPITAIAATPSGNGYWLVARDGAVYAYGDARYAGGLSAVGLSGPIVGMAVTASGRGYWLAGADGGVYAFGDAIYVGGLSGRPHAPIVSIARATRGNGYWLAGSDGGVFAFGASGYFGSVGASRLNRRIVAIASGDGIAIPKAPTAPASTDGFDISWPQCDGIRPAAPYGFGVVGVTGGHLFSLNPCLDQQWRWATDYGSFAAVYLNTNAPTAAEFATFALHRAWGCGANTACVLDQWGRQGARQALHDAASIPAPMWWLDVETANQWLTDPAANAVILRGAIDELRKAGKSVGVYSTSLQWGRIAGSFSPKLPLWIPGAPPDSPGSYCAGHDFGGGLAWMAQSGDSDFDTDVLCGAGLANYRTAFAAPQPMVVPQYGVPGGGLAAVQHHPSPLDRAIEALGHEAEGAVGIAVLAGGHSGRHAPGLAGWLLLLFGAGALGCLARIGGRRLGTALLGAGPTVGGPGPPAAEPWPASWGQSGEGGGRALVSPGARTGETASAGRS